MPACRLYLLFISADAAKEKEKKVLLPTGANVINIYRRKFIAHEIYICGLSCNFLLQDILVP
jgi:hypothetical protein